MELKIYREKFAICEVFPLLLVVSSIPFIKNGFTASTIAQIGINAILILLAMSDIAVMRIPNLYIIGLAILSVFKISSIQIWVANAICVIFLYIYLEVINWVLAKVSSKKRGVHISSVIGGGDVKLYAVSSLFLGLQSMMVIVISCLLLIGYCIIRRLFAGNKKADKHEKIAMGPFIAIAIYAYCLSGI